MLTQTHKEIYVFDLAFMCLNGNRIWGDIFNVHKIKGAYHSLLLKWLFAFYYFFFFITFNIYLGR